MKPEIAKLWIEDLRSGLHAQTRGALRDGNGFCCLGRLCDLHAAATGGEWKKLNLGASYLYVQKTLPTAVQVWSGMKSSDGKFETDSGYRQNLSRMNDTGGTFKAIAKVIEDNVERL